MPIVTTEEPLGFTHFIPETAKEVPPESLDVWAAAFEEEHTVGSMIAASKHITEFPAVDGYNPYDDIEGYEDFADYFMDSDSQQESAAIKQRINEEKQNKQILASAGPEGIAAQFAAGLSDPVYLPLMAAGVGEARLGESLFKSAVKAFAGGTVAEVPAEVIKQASQTTRTKEESFFNIGASTLVSGILGTSLSAVSHGQYQKVVADVDAAIKSAEPELVYSGAPRSIGAAQAAGVELTKEELELVSVGGLEKIGVSPQIRVLNSESQATQNIGHQMMESALLTKAAREGKSPVPEGGAVETRIKQYDAGLAQYVSDTNDYYKAYVKSLRGTGKKKLSRTEFSIEVGKAARRGDDHPIPEVGNAAKSLRKNVLDPAKNSAIEVGLLPEDVKVGTSESYLMRSYNTKKIIAKRNEWNQIVEDWFKRIRQENLMKVEAKIAAKEEVSQALKAQAYISDAEIREAVDSITNNILGTPAGQLPYGVKVTVRGPLQERVLNIPDRQIEDFLESDADFIAQAYTRTMATDIELTRMFGDVDMKAQIKDIIDDYDTKIREAKTEKERTALEKKMTRDIKDVEAIRDRLRGTYRMPDDPDSFFYKAGRTIRDLNFLRMLGGMVISAIPDIARMVSVNGMKPFSRGLQSLAASPAKLKLSKAEARKAAVGLDMVLNSRATSLSDVSELYGRGSRFERGMKATSDAFSKVTLMSQWNASMKQFAGVITQDRILSECINWKSGNISKPNMARLAASGIDQRMAERIADQFEKYGDGGTLNLSNGDKWDDASALQSFRAAVLKDVDRTIVTPGVGEKPLWTSSEMGKMVFQFKTFAAAAHHKVMLADLQYRDASAATGFLLASALGTLSYGIKQYLRGNEVEKDPAKLTVEALDNSGVMGYMMEVSNISEKLTANKIGVNAVIGAQPMSRYASRNAVASFAGPSFGTATDIAQASNAAWSGEWTEQDAKRMRQLLPFQNLFYMRWVFDRIQEGMGGEIE